MSGDTLQILIAMSSYMILVIAIGLFFAKRANASSENYFLGGRSLGPWITAMSAEASDMSGWLLMGLPGVAYWCGLSDAIWTAIGLAVGTYLNWLVVARRFAPVFRRGGRLHHPAGFLQPALQRKKAGSDDPLRLVYSDLLHRLCGKLFRHLWQAVQHAIRDAVPSHDDCRCTLCHPLYASRRLSCGNRL